eukprot:12580567-Alexandrium_andersonii.AAC.1
MSGQTLPSLSRLWPERLRTSLRAAGARSSTYFGTFRAPRTFPLSPTSHFRLPTSASFASSVTPAGLVAFRLARPLLASSSSTAAQRSAPVPGQESVATSSCEAELYGMGTAIAEALHLQHLLAQAGLILKEPTLVLHTDSTSA